jgi:hypothetical protein
VRFFIFLLDNECNNKRERIRNAGFKKEKLSLTMVGIRIIGIIYALSKQGYAHKLLCQTKIFCSFLVRMVIAERSYFIRFLRSCDLFGKFRLFLHFTAMIAYAT